MSEKLFKWDDKLQKTNKQTNKTEWKVVLMTNNTKHTTCDAHDVSWLTYARHLLYKLFVNR